MSEDSHRASWIKHWPSHGLEVGPGDDCAVFSSRSLKGQMVWKTDAIVQDIHFRKTDSAQAIGHKALARVLSDFAAMGATPLSTLVTVGLPKELPMKKIEEAYRGMARLASQWNISLAGGETTRSEQWWFSICGLGWVKKGQAVLRSGAKPKDLIYVTGKLGGSFPKRHLSFMPRLDEGRWLGEKGLATAMMDLSDGLGSDLPKLASASKVSFAIKASSIPRHKNCSQNQAVNDGEDYELLFTVKPHQEKQLREKWPFKTPLTCIGQITKAQEENFLDGLMFYGYDHLRKSTSD